MAEATAGLDLGAAAALLAAGVIAVPVFKRVGLGSVLGYLAAGLAIGPFGLKLFREPETILHVAEFGVVIFLFIIGLEMRPKRLWGLRKEIFGLGAAQVLFCGLILTLTAMLAGFSAPVAFVGAMGFVLSSTAVIMQMLEERGEIAGGPGQRAVSILLLEDLAIVPLLAIVAVLASVTGQATEHAPPLWRTIGFAVAAVGGVLLAGRYAVNPIFRLLARYGGREVMTAAALLVVVGAAWAMSLGGLSMAMGAFLAGVLMSESTYRHQLEVDIEPFRGILLGLFFLAIGMSLDLAILARNAGLVLFFVTVYMAGKAAAIFAVARLFRASSRESAGRAIFMAQGGEFAFVLYAAAAGAGVFTPEQHAVLLAVIILSMALTPLGVMAFNRFSRSQAPSSDGLEAPRDADLSHRAALVIGFGRVGQVVSQILMERGHAVSIIDTDVEMIEVARGFDYEVYYGDGTRRDILRSAGAGTAPIAVVCVDETGAANRVTTLLKSEFPNLPVLARSVDRVHSLALLEAGADQAVRETFESSIILGADALLRLGASKPEVDRVVEVFRLRDEQRFAAQKLGGVQAGAIYFRGGRASASASASGEKSPNGD